MDAQQLSEQLVDYVYGELSAEQAAAFERSLADHPEVQRELEAMQQTRSTVGELEQFDPPPALTQRLLAEATALAPGEAQPTLLDRIHAGLRLLVSQPAVSAAVTVVLVLGLSLYVYRLGPPTEEPAPAGIVAHPAHDERVPVGPRKSAKGAAETEPSEKQPLGALASKNIAKKAPTPKRASRRSLYGRGTRGGGRLKSDHRGSGDTSGARKQRRRRKRKSAAKSQARTQSATESLAEDYPKRAKGGRRDLDTLGHAAPAQAPSGPPRAEADLALETKRRMVAKPFPTAPTARTNPGTTTMTPPMPARRARTRASELEGASGAIGGTPGDEMDDKAATQNKELRRQARTWLARGTAAVKGRDCKGALAYFDRAIRADASMAAQVERTLGPCSPQLQRSTKAYPRLAQQVARARTHRIKQEKAAARRKAPAAAPAETENKR